MKMKHYLGFLILGILLALTFAFSAQSFITGGPGEVYDFVLRNSFL